MSVKCFFHRLIRDSRKSIKLYNYLYASFEICNLQYYLLMYSVINFTCPVALRLRWHLHPWNILMYGVNVHELYFINHNVSHRQCVVQPGVCQSFCQLLCRISWKQIGPVLFVCAFSILCSHLSNQIANIRKLKS